MSTGRIRRSPSISTRAMIVIAVVGLILLATAYFAATAALPFERLDMIPIRWSGDLAV
ncbi:MAG TPA: hypothetical protein VFT63_00110 [bacterium]|nr:hypothetical protein [bacterium]